MDKMPTAEEFLQDAHNISYFYIDESDKMVCYGEDVKKVMIEFAKLHVEAALKAATKAAEIDLCVEDDGTIKESYPLTNIK